MVDYTFETERCSANYDMQHILFVTYRGVLTPDVTAAMYRWMFDLIKKGTHDIHETRGALYDFRAVTQFSSTNIGTTQRQSQQINTNVDMSHIPVALVCGNTMQHEWVRVSMKITPGMDRKRIVKTPEEGLAFFEEFAARRALEAQTPTEPAPIPAVTLNPDDPEDTVPLVPPAQPAGQTGTPTL